MRRDTVQGGKHAWTGVQMKSRIDYAWQECLEKQRLSASAETAEHSEMVKGGKGLVISAGSTGVNPKHNAQSLLILS